MLNVRGVDYTITFNLPKKNARINEWKKLHKMIDQEVLETLAQAVSMVKGDDFGDELLNND